MKTQSYLSMCRSTPEALLRAAASGIAPSPASLAGWEFRGWFTRGTFPALLAGKHRKGFYRLGRSPGLGGYNIPCHPGPPSTPWVDRLRGPGSWRLGWFLVVEEDGCLILDYSRAGKASPLSPLVPLRERLFQSSPDDPDHLLTILEIHVGRSVRRVSMGVYERHTRSPMGI